MKHVRSIVIGAALLAALAASSVSAQPLDGRWVTRWVPACRVAGTSFVTYNLATCYKFHWPIIYVAYRTWVP